MPRQVPRHLVPARWCDSDISSTMALDLSQLALGDDQIDVVAHRPPTRAQVPHPPIRMTPGTAAKRSSRTASDSSACSDE